MKAHVKRSERAKERRRRFRAVREERALKLKQRQTLIKATVSALSPKPVAFDLETLARRTHQKYVNFGLTYGMDFGFQSPSKAKFPVAKQTKTDVFIMADYADLELRAMAALLPKS